MKRVTNDEILAELKRVYAENGDRIPQSSKWRKLGGFSLDVLLRAFGSYKAAWEAAGFEYDVGSNWRKKADIILGLQKAFIADRTLGVESLIRASGCTIPTIMKYFGSTHNALLAAKIDLNKRLTDEMLIEEYTRTYTDLGRVPSARDLNRHSKYAANTYMRRFTSLEEVAKKAGVTMVLKLKETDEELLLELKRVCELLGRAPTIIELSESCKYSHNVYDRAFGSFAAALGKLGFTANQSSKAAQTCSVCGLSSTALIAHTLAQHPDEHSRQEALVVELFKSGLSQRQIAVRDDVIFRGATSVNRVIRKHLTAEEIETLRRSKIQSKLRTDYAEGKYDWVNHLNRQRNMTPEAREKNAAGLTKAYAEGERTAWNKGQTKETSAVIARASAKISEHMKYQFTSGELDKAIGPEGANWNEERDQVANRYRLGLGFTAEQRGLIKKRADYKCQTCGVSQESLEELGQTLECDHVIAICLGGLQDWDTNGQALCPSCHQAKTDADVGKSV